MGPPGTNSTFMDHNVVDYGADPTDDDTHDDQPGIQAALDAAKAQGGGVVWLPFGVYNLHSPIAIDDPGYEQSKLLTVEGNRSTLKAVCADGVLEGCMACSQSMEHVLYARHQAGLSLKNLIIDANHTAEHGLRAVKMGAAYQASMDGVRVSRALSHGFSLEACQTLAVRSSQSQNNRGAGWHIQGANGSSFHNVDAFENGRCGAECQGDDISHGFLVAGMPGYSGGAWLTAFRSEKNCGAGVVMEPGPGQNTTNSNSVTLQNGWLEGNVGDGVRVGISNVLVTGLRILAAADTPNSRAFRILDDVRATTLIGNRVANNGNNPDNDPVNPGFGVVVLEGVSTLESQYIQGNFHLYSGQPLAVHAL